MVREDYSHHQAFEEDLRTALRQAGRAESLGHALHNIGNVLNSINIATARLVENAKVSELENFEALTELLQRHQQDLPSFMATDPTGQHLAPYLLQSVVRLREEHRILREELETVTLGIDHLKGILTLQRNHVQVGSSDAEVDPLDLLKTLIRLHRPVFELQHIVVDGPIGQARSLTCSRHVILQILVNLVSNAVTALADLPPGTGRIRFALQDEGDDLILEVGDNGVGIPVDQRHLIFRGGFTTRPGGKGLGLRHAALQAAALGGRLEVHSAGRGTGATFRLMLPRPRSAIP